MDPLIHCTLSVTVPRSQAGAVVGRMSGLLAEAVDTGLALNYSSLTVSPYVEDDDVKEEGSSE